MTNGEARLRRINHGRGHSYRLDGEKVDGVTTAISTGFPINLKQWAADTAANYAVEHWDELAEEPLTRRLDRMRYAHRETLNKAAARGTQIHGYGERLVSGESVEIPDDYLGPAQAYARFLDDWQIEPLATEAPLVSVEHRYAGTLDLVASIGVRAGARALVDIKTGRAVYESVALQAAAYRYADLWQPNGPDSEEPLPPVELVYVAHVGPDSVRMLPIEAGPAAFRQFLYVLETARWIGRHGWQGDAPVIGTAEDLNGYGVSA
jgi:hypothetical protein